MTILDAVNEGMTRRTRGNWSYESYANGLLRIWEKLPNIPERGGLGFFCFGCDRGF